MRAVGQRSLGGKGHLAEAKVAVQSGLAGAKSAYQRQGDEKAGGCGGGDTSQRDELLAKVRQAATRKE